MVVVVTLFNLTKDKIDRFIGSAFICVQRTNNENGCIMCNLYQGKENKSKFAMLEKWESMNDLTRHQQSDTVNGFAQPVKTFILTDGIFNISIGNIDNGCADVGNTIIRLGIPEDKIDEFIGVNYDFVKATSKQNGCYIYNIHQDLQNKTNIFFIEKWDVVEGKKQVNNPIPEKKVFETKIKKGNLIKDGEKFSFGRAIFNVNYNKRSKL